MSPMRDDGYTSPLSSTSFGSLNPLSPFPNPKSNVQEKFVEWAEQR
jgi:hypothetical protein